jgi:hypothetical protein
MDDLPTDGGMGAAVREAGKYSNLTENFGRLIWSLNKWPSTFLQDISL